MAAVNPYLTFDSSCEAAFTFYKSVFGGEFLTIMRFKDAPSDQALPENEGKKIMHVALPIGKGSILMGSDRLAMHGPATKGDNFSIAIGAESEEEAKKLFNGLSSGGKVTMPLDKTFWGAYFGMFTDQFGINWMVNYDYSQQK